ncbi:putative disease resistance protein RGA4 [Glycine soja]
MRIGQLSHMLSIHTSDPSFISIWHSYNMAEAVLEIVLENLKSILQKELGQFLGVDDDMKRLASLFTTIKATLEDAEEKQFSNRVIKDWLAKLKDESLILDDILEEFDLLDKGASILVTTRLSKVATIMGTMSPHELSELSDNDCWELFKHRTFGQNDVEQEELVVIGREIGVPLAAKALGGILRFKRNKNKWLNVKESKLLKLSHNEKSIMFVLRLSYLNLPIKLRQCFAYCAIFPKDEKIEKQYLIELWMANGFISSNERLDAKEVGDGGVWNELYWRLFFQDIERDEFDKVTKDICCVTDDISISDLPERIHHLSNYMKRFSLELINSILLHQVKSLRTYINYSGHRYSPYVFKCYSLRVLDFKGITTLTSSIGDLKHQILKLNNCRSLQKFHNSLICLKALQQLFVKDCYSLTSLPPQIEKLTSLKDFKESESMMNAKDANMSSKQLNDVEEILYCFNLIPNNLKVCGLDDCQSCLPLSHLRKLPSLKELRIYNMTHVEYPHEKSYDVELRDNIVASRGGPTFSSIGVMNP